MDKLKQVISGQKNQDDAVHGQGADTANTGTGHHQASNVGGLSGQGSHFSSAKEGNHPIYDEMTGHGSPSSATNTGLTGTGSPQTSSLPTRSAETTGHQGTAAYPGITSGLGDSHKSATLSPDTPQRPGAREDVSSASMKSGTLGHLPPQTEQTGQSHLGRDAALGTGAGLGAGALGEHELKQHQATTSGQPSGLQDTDRSFPLAGGVAGNQSTQPTSQAEPHDGRQALAGAAAAAAPTSSDPIDGHEHGGRGHTFMGDPCGDNETPSNSGTLFATGPHSTDTANRLDPHVPGAFPDATPTEERREPGFQQQQGRDAGLASAGATTAWNRHEGDRSAQPVTGTSHQPAEKSASQHHYGRDAALAGATAAGAGGLYESQHRDTGPASSTLGPHQSNAANVADPRVQPDPQLQKHHEARSTAEDPASKTIGPHKSNIANIVDPRVQPEPEKMKGHTTTGPHKSDTLNKADPKVKENEPQAGDKHHYGRDAALAGGAGAAGLGAYEAGKGHDKERDVPSNTYGEREANPYSSSKVDPRVNPSSRTTQSAQDPSSQSQHHYGRDAALAGGAGAAGLGAYEAGKGHEGHQPTTQPTRGMDEQSFDPTARPTQTGSQPTGTRDHHYGRDAALAGGAGAGGLGAYEATKHHPGPQDTTQTGSTGSTGYPSTTGTGPGAHEAARPYDQHPMTQPSAGMNEQRFDPTARGAQDPGQPKDHHYGRDAALVGGTGAAGAGAYEYAKRHGHDGVQDPATSRTHGPGATQQNYDPMTRQTQDPTQQKDHHYGRDAAMVGGTGAAGAGAYEYEKHHGHDGVQDPATSRTHGPGATQQSYDPMTRQTQDPTQQKDHHYGRDAAMVGGTGAAGAGAYEYAKHHGHEGTQDPSISRTQDPTRTQQTYDPTSRQMQDPNQSKDHHYGRDAALVGGTGAAGAGAYEYAKHHGHDDARDPTTQQATPGQGYDPTGRQTQDPYQAKDHHYGRDAAIVGGAGAAGAGAEHEYSKHEAEKAEKERLKQQKAEEKQHNKGLAAEEKHHKKEVAAEEKKHQKEAEKQEKQHEKEVEKQEKKHEKEAAAIAAARQKEAEKKEKQHEKEVMKEERNNSKELEREGSHGEKEKKPGLLDRILHRHRDGPSEEEKLHSGVYTAGGAGAAGAAAEEGPHKLHKDPPPGHPAREAGEHQQHMGTDGPIGQHGTTGNQTGPYGNEGYGAGNETQRVTEPHTGLPMNTAKYGDGAGGTDGNPAIHGMSSQEQGGHSGADWERIKKANTPY